VIKRYLLLLPDNYPNLEYEMIKTSRSSISFFCCFLFSVASAQSPCGNIDFEQSAAGQYTTSGAISGWTLSSQSALSSNNCSSAPSWTAGSPEFSLVNTPLTGVPYLGTVSASPLGGQRIALFHNDQMPYGLRTKLTYSMAVTSSNSMFKYAFAGIYDSGGHNCCDQPLLQVRLLDCSQNPLSCASTTLIAATPGCTNSANSFTISNSVAWTHWQVNTIDLTPYIGTCVFIEVINSDCIFAGHYGISYFDAQCGTQLLSPGLTSFGGVAPVSFCSNSGQAIVSAPYGYVSYQWIAPGTGSVQAPQGTMSSLTIQNPVPGSVYTVNLVTQSGCQYMATYTLTFSQVNIAGIGAGPTCPGLSNGSATVQGNGSGTGYTYSWTSPSNSVVGTTSVATGLSAGIHTVMISALGTPGCGTAWATVTVTTAGSGPSVSVSANSTLICAGNTVNLSAGGTAVSYSWTNGPATATHTAAPAANTIYTVTGTDPSMSCVAIATIGVFVYTPAISVSASADTLCEGETSTLTATGGSVYLWSNSVNGPINVITPPATTVYFVTVSADSLSAQCVITKSIQVLVNPNPTVTASASTYTNCAGEQVSFLGTGATTYTWSNGVPGPAINVTPMVVGNLTLVLNGTDPNGCKDSDTVLVAIMDCTGIYDGEVFDPGFKLYPNPSAGLFVIHCHSGTDLEIFSELGELVRNYRVSSRDSIITISDLKAGFYLVRSKGLKGRSIKVLVTN
jgi:hypothetical protein